MDLCKKKLSSILVLFVLTGCDLSDASPVERPGDASADGATPGDVVSGDGSAPDGISPGGGSPDGSSRDGGDSGVPPIVCDPGLLDCNGVAADGCEVTASTDPANCGRCGHHCSAACVAGSCAPVDVATGMGSSVSATAVKDGIVYLAFLTISGPVLDMVPISGGNVTEIAFPGGGNIGGIAFDGGRVFITVGPNVMRVEPGTLTPTVVATAPAPSTDLGWLVRAGTTWYSSDIDTNCTSGSCCTLGVPCDPGRIWALPDGAPATVVAPGENSPRRLQSDATHLYWIDASEKDSAGTGTIPYGEGAIRRLSLSGGSPETVAGNLFWPQGLALDGSEGAVFATMGDKIPATVGRVPRSGGAPTLVSPDEGLDVIEVVSLPAGVVWNSRDRAKPTVEHLRFAPKTGPIQTLLDSPMIRGLAAVGNDVYALVFASTTAPNPWRLVRFTP